MPPLRGFGIISIQNYKDVAPTALKPARINDFVAVTGFLETRKRGVIFLAIAGIIHANP